MTTSARNNTWTLVPQPKHANVVGPKWGFRTKYLSPSSVYWFKVRLVAQGFTQIHGLDYSVTFSPVVKASTIRIVLSISMLNRWSLHQLDVKKAFLNDNLTETVFYGTTTGILKLTVSNTSL
ncbi:uncharacterized mitochondrial protein AtMg00820-like [Rutidosis leptorrhynchoides]|uniref:uncharacterized mitochondrial protein AtMg00820-like n=1 Tax=Rutidosis leptorrhynchoides TaxID=125765 RepID=UPI003A998209